MYRCNGLKSASQWNKEHIPLENRAFLPQLPTDKLGNSKNRQLVLKLKKIKRKKANLINKLLFASKSFHYFGQINEDSSLAILAESLSMDAEAVHFHSAIQCSCVLEKDADIAEGSHSLLTHTSY